MRKTLVTTTLTTLAGVTLAVPATADPPPAALTSDQDGQAVALPGGASWGAEASPVMSPARAVRYWTVGKQSKARTADLPESLPSTDSEHGGEWAALRRSVPSAKRITPGADANGYAEVRRPYTRTPYSRISGRLFFINAAGQGDSCSASVVRSAARLLIVTAAHCVYGVPLGATAGVWHSNFAFVPAYDGRATSVRQREPYGRWGGRRAWKPDGYTGADGGDWNSIYDIALIEVGKRDRTLQEAVGAFTPLLNQGGRHTIATTGYPGLLGRKPYDGRDQLWCLGRTRQGESVSGDQTMLAARATGQPSQAGRMETSNCHLYKGHSGGPWILRKTGDLVGVLSAGKEDGETEGNSVANAINLEGYGAIIKQADPRGVYDALSVKLSGPARPVPRGGSATVTATVTMHGLMATAQVPVKLTFPPGTSPASTSTASTSGTTCKHAHRAAGCTIGVIHPGKPVRITTRLNVAADAPHRLPVVARVTSTRLDPTQRDNVSTLRLQARR